MRAEKVKIEKDALERLTEVESKSALKYSVQLLNLATQNAKAVGRAQKIKGGRGFSRARRF